MSVCQHFLSRAGRAGTFVVVLRFDAVAIIVVVTARVGSTAAVHRLRPRIRILAHLGVATVASFGNVSGRRGARLDGLFGIIVAEAVTVDIWVIDVHLGNVHKVPSCRLCRSAAAIAIAAGLRRPFIQPHATSLAVPLQLASFPASQVSAAKGATPPEQLPHALDAPPFAAVHVWVPARHGPLPSYPGCVSHARTAPGAHVQTVSIALSGLPSQSLSIEEEQLRALA